VRKVIQIAVAAAPCEPTAHPEFVEIIALCDDGAIFTGTGSINGKWQQLPPIPQPEIADCDITFEWQQLPPNHTAINRGDDVVMPRVGDIIFVSNDQRVISGDYKFCGIVGHEVKVRYFQAISYWNFWRYSESDPWRDASGKIVEV
jgi:hypothetical protein